ncbi:exodeoxyribonuclease VII small subunit [Gaoshiqia sediminis]|uniref:Exodeoxyribonuclease VII small subunit n=1 Tax=Gaoshiqia sediminis TaxID=2986998 RepID=A0AA42C582_9BACT|nr:exodeoxyribonuclease VII small subunit [Gaoshiqia sediminis]MCW0482538.1 exodeoxyribonuclease VII small subunit [Gaoshiqia sediminis]
MVQKKLTYKDAVDEIDDILEKIENEELDVDELSEKVKRVSTLIKFCKEKLHKTETEVENILKEMDE